MDSFVRIRLESSSGFSTMLSISKILCFVNEYWKNSDFLQQYTIIPDKSVGQNRNYTGTAQRQSPPGGHMAALFPAAPRAALPAAGSTGTDSHMIEKVELLCFLPKIFLIFWRQNFHIIIDGFHTRWYDGLVIKGFDKKISKSYRIAIDNHVTM